MGRRKMIDNDNEFNKERLAFVPKTSILGVYGTSYGIQLGIISNQLGLRVFRGKEVILFNKFEKKDINANHLTAWIMSNLAIPNINAYQVLRTVRYLIVQLNK